MRVKITVGEVEVTTQGVDLTYRQMTAMLTRCASIALALNVGEPEGKPAATGFTAHLDLDPERNLAEDTSEWFEESP
jgi:hypothetical protein